MKDELKEICNLIKEVMSLQDGYILSLEREIDFIILNKIVDDNKVATIFDNLLNLLQTDKTLELYKKLCRYYYFVNPRLVTDYVYCYKEMYIDEDEKELKL